MRCGLFQFHLTLDSSPQSFGIHVAELARFPPRVVAMARRKARQLETFDVKKRRRTTEEEEEGEGEEERGGESVIPLAVRQEGERHMINFLEAVKNAGPTVTMDRLEALRQELFAANNDYVRSVLSGGSNSLLAGATGQD